MKRNPRPAGLRVQTRMRTNFSGVDIVPDVARLCATRRGDAADPEFLQG
jgi:hypothetical protein